MSTSSKQPHSSQHIPFYLGYWITIFFFLQKN